MITIYDASIIQHKTTQKSNDIIHMNHSEYEASHHVYFFRFQGDFITLILKSRQLLDNIHWSNLNFCLTHLHRSSH